MTIRTRKKLEKNFVLVFKNDNLNRTYLHKEDSKTEMIRRIKKKLQKPSNGIYVKIFDKESVGMKKMSTNFKETVI